MALPDLTTATLERIPADVLIKLAERNRIHAPRPNAWAKLDPDALDEAFAMVAAGQPPALGWWKRHLPAPPTPDVPTPSPAQPPRAWQPWELVVAAINMAEDGYTGPDARALLAEHAFNHGLSAEDLAAAYIALEDSP